MLKDSSCYRIFDDKFDPEDASEIAHVTLFTVELLSFDVNYFSTRVISLADNTIRLRNRRMKEGIK